MGFDIGIVGLPNVGKSTLFQAITETPAAAENYPFCTIEPNQGIVDVPDDRLSYIARCFSSEKIIPNSIRMVDIAGLVKGAADGEGLGNQFLSHIRQVDVIAHVVRCFENDNIVHVSGQVDPVDDITTIHIELCLADIEQVTKKYEKTEKSILDTCLTAVAPNEGNSSQDIELWIKWSDAMNENEYNSQKLDVLDTISSTCSGNRGRSLSDCTTEVELCGFLRKAINDTCTLSTVSCSEDRLGVMKARKYYHNTFGFSDCE